MKDVKHLPLLEKILPAVYVLMAGLCIWLNNGSDSNHDRTSLYVNAGMFVIVAIIFFLAGRKMNQTGEMILSLQSTTERIRKDYETQGHRLGEEYIKRKDLFQNDILKNQYKKYQKEVLRQRNEKIPSVCDISDYINYALIDTTIKKNLLNQVPGAMTGLGILGTFIGLSFGLQAFNTGTAEEITNSIPHLMDGIKVAFHTSIYGMVFSLMFVIVYKKILQIAYEVMGEFLSIYEENVMPNMENDAVSNLLNYQNQQSFYLKSLFEWVSQLLVEQIGAAIIPELKAIRQKTDMIPGNIAHEIAESVVPELKSMHESIEKFIDASTRSQLEGIDKLVDSFMTNMNSAVSDNFANLSNALDRTTEVQNQQCDYLETVVKRIGELAVNLKELNTISEQTIEKTSAYVEEIQQMQSSLNTGMSKVTEQMSANNRLLNEYDAQMKAMETYHETVAENTNQFVAKVNSHMDEQDKAVKDIIQSAQCSEKNISDLAVKYSEVIEKTAKQHMETVSENADKHIKKMMVLSNGIQGDINTASKELLKAMEQLKQELDGCVQNTFISFDKNLSEITRHLSGTISQINTTTEKVPEVVATAFDGMENSFAEMQNRMNALLKSLEEYQNEIEKITDADKKETTQQTDGVM